MTTTETTPPVPITEESLAPPAALTIPYALGDRAMYGALHSQEERIIVQGVSYAGEDPSFVHIQKPTTYPNYPA